MDDLLSARQQAAAALEAGRKLALRAVQQRRGLPAVDEPNGIPLGALIGTPAAFWAGAAAYQVDGDDEAVEALTLATQLAAARVAAGDMAFIRESLIGQAQWLNVMAVRLLARGESVRDRPDLEAQYVKLALAAQRQATQCLASVAALDKLKDAGGVEVKG